MDTPSGPRAPERARCWLLARPFGAFGSEGGGEGVFETTKPSKQMEIGGDKLKHIVPQTRPPTQL
ncbi:MAG: hypothetical protein D6765_12665 [Bacteroidetes bacterium]|nr:MAG: hypothetical protein D6765_12665 [Bacteroidota bacterium]